jgi:hypothetical protein
MATERDVEYNQMSQNACVLLLDGLRPMILKVTHYSSLDPSASRSTGRGCVNPFFCVVISVKSHPGTALESPGYPDSDYDTVTLR